MTTPSKIIPSNFLFRFRFLCRRWDAPSPRAVDPETLDASFRIPLWSFIPKSEARLERQTQQPVIAAGKGAQVGQKRGAAQALGLLAQAVGGAE